jgi:hypothetical protein
MASKFRNDILVPLEIEPIEAPREASKLTAFIPIALALVGVAAILGGGISAKTREVASRASVDTMVTGSIGPAMLQNGAPANAATER